MDWIEVIKPKVQGKQKTPKEVIVSYREDKTAAHTTKGGKGKVARAFAKRAR